MNKLQDELSNSGGPKSGSAFGDYPAIVSAISTSSGIPKPWCSLGYQQVITALRGGASILVAQ